MKNFSLIYEGQFGTCAIDLETDHLGKAKIKANRLMKTVRPRPSNLLFSVSYSDSETGKCGIAFNGVVK